MTVQNYRQAARPKQRGFLGMKQATAKLGLHEHRGATYLPLFLNS